VGTVLGFELKTSGLLGRCWTTWAMLPALFSYCPTFFLTSILLWHLYIWHNLRSSFVQDGVQINTQEKEDTANKGATDVLSPKQLLQLHGPTGPPCPSYKEARRRQPTSRRCWSSGCP
jgi:hypothetical protein